MEEKRLSRIQRENIYNLCIGCLNRICITDDKEEVLGLIASLNHHVSRLGKDTFLRIDLENGGELC